MVESWIRTLLDFSVESSESANSIPELSVVLVVRVERSIFLNIFNKIGYLIIREIREHLVRSVNELSIHLALEAFLLLFERELRNIEVQPSHMSDVIHWLLVSSFYSQVCSQFRLIFEEFFIIFERPALCHYFFLIRLLGGYIIILTHLFSYFKIRPIEEEKIRLATNINKISNVWQPRKHCSNCSSIKLELPATALDWE